ncbi:MAG: ArsR/SmtB family transcription factor [Brooklawnia sp.]|jgi:ArsR family transcriptional regulator
MITSLPLATTTDTAACCAPVIAGGMDTADAQRLARIFKALGDPTRVRLVSMIAASPEGEACMCDLTEPVGLSQPTVSHHMKQLVDAGLLTREQRGKWAYYSIVPETLAMLSRVLDPAFMQVGRTVPRDPATLSTRSR